MRDENYYAKIEADEAKRRMNERRQTLWQDIVSISINREPGSISNAVLRADKVLDEFDKRFNKR